MMKTKKVDAFFIFKIIICVILLLYCVLLYVPLIWGVFTSFKTSGEFRLNAFGFPEKFTLQNYMQAFRLLYVDVSRGVGVTVRVRLIHMFGYSILYAGGCGLIATATACIMAYAVAKFSKFYMSKVIYMIVLVAMVTPIVGNLPSEIQVARTLGLFDTMWGIWIMKMSFLGMYFLVFHATFKSLP